MTKLNVHRYNGHNVIYVVGGFTQICGCYDLTINSKVKPIVQANYIFSIICAD